MDLSGIPYMLIINILLAAVLVGLVVYVFYFTPKFKRVDEGFFGGVARGSGHPDCLRTLPEGSQILDVLMGRGLTDKGADYAELQLILSKLGCLKKDLMSPSGIVEATRYQAFETHHDRINVAEVCASCLNQTIAARDLDIIFATWRDRGAVLLRRLCTEAQLSETQVVQLEGLYKKAWEDVYEIAKSRCLKTDFGAQNGGATSGGDVGAYEPEGIKDLRAYGNKYGGLSASGWNGAV
jgi:hypothetical protein